MRSFCRLGRVRHETQQSPTEALGLAKRSTHPTAERGKGMDEPKPPQHEEDYVETERDRRIANIVLLLVFVALVGGGLWLANAMLDQRTLDDCLAQGRRN